MKFLRRIRTFCLAALLTGVSAAPALAQTYYAALPNAQIQFFDASGNPLNGGKLYTYIAGTSTQQNSYTDSTGLSANTNPVVLDSAGRASVWLASTNSYKLTLRTSADVLVWEKDNVSDFGAVLKRDLATSFTTKSLDGERLASQFQGANAGAQIAAAIADGPSTGVRVSATGLPGAQAWSSDPFTGVTKPVILELGEGTTTISANVTIPSNVTLELAQGAILSVNNGLTLTINGGIKATLSRHFSGSGSFNFTGAKINEVYTEWWGAISGDATDDTSAFTSALASFKTVAAIPAGAYTVSTFAMPANTTLMGLGGKAEINQPSASAASSIVTIGANGARLESLLFSGSVAAGTEGGQVSAITLTKAGTLSDITIRGVETSGKNAGIYAEGNGSFALSNINILGNKIRALHFGITLGPFANGVVNDGVVVDGNDVLVEPVGGYASFEFARGIQVFNTNNSRISNNFARGGFAGIETLGNLGNPSTDRPHQRNVQVVNNRIDSFLSFVQADGSVLANNIVDMALRPAGVPGFDDATVVAMWGHIPGIEAAALEHTSVVGNIVRGSVGPCIDFGDAVNVSVTGNVVSDCNTIASPSASYSGGILLDYTIEDSVVTNNTINGSGASGINQIGSSIPTGRLDRVTITGNIISNVEWHGIHLRNVGNSSVSFNNIFDPNLAASTYNGIDFTAAGGGADYVVEGVDIRGNRIDGGNYGIYQPYTDSASKRLSFIEGNTAENYDTAGFLVHGRTRNNWDAVESPTFGSLSLSTGHLDISDARDVITLDPGGAANFTHIDNGTAGDRKAIYFARADTTLVGTDPAGPLRLTGNVNVTPGIGSIIEFLCINDTNPVAQVWLEVSRTIR
jgi:parallel beta-helix repeat protein